MFAPVQIYQKFPATLLGFEFGDHPRAIFIASPNWYFFAMLHCKEYLVKGYIAVVGKQFGLVLFPR